MEHDSIIEWQEDDQVFHFPLARMLVRPASSPGEKLVRRWGFVSNIGISTCQFNVYRTVNGYRVTQQDEKGNESEHMTHIQGGECSSLMDAYMKASSVLSDILIVSSALGPQAQNKANLIVDTTPGREWAPLAILIAEGQVASEIRSDGFDERIGQNLNNHSAERAQLSPSTKKEPTGCMTLLLGLVLVIALLTLVG